MPFNLFFKRVKFSFYLHIFQVFIELLGLQVLYIFKYPLGVSNLVLFAQISSCTFRPSRCI